MIVLHCRKPRFLSLPVSPPIYWSKSEKFQLWITARRIIIFGAGELHRAIFVLCFFLFLNPDAEIMLNLLFNTLLTITPHNTQKRRRKEKTTYGPWRSSRWVTLPVRNPDRQGLTWAPELKLNFSGRNNFFGGIFCLEYPSRRNENRLRVVRHFPYNYRFSFRKLQILISQTTDFHFANYRFSFHFVSFHFVSFPFVSLYFVSQTTVINFTCILRDEFKRFIEELPYEELRQSIFTEE